MRLTSVLHASYIRLTCVIHPSYMRLRFSKTPRLTTVLPSGPAVTRQPPPVDGQFFVHYAPTAGECSSGVSLPTTTPRRMDYRGICTFAVRSAWLPSPSRRVRSGVRRTSARLLFLLFFFEFSRTALSVSREAPLVTGPAPLGRLLSRVFSLRSSVLCGRPGRRPATPPRSCCARCRDLLPTSPPIQPGSMHAERRDPTRQITASARVVRAWKAACSLPVQEG